MPVLFSLRDDRCPSIDGLKYSRELNPSKSYNSPSEGA